MILAGFSACAPTGDLCAPLSLSLARGLWLLVGARPEARPRREARRLYVGALQRQARSVMQ